MNYRLVLNIIGIIFILLWITLVGVIGYSFYTEFNNVLNVNTKLYISVTHLLALGFGVVFLIIAFLLSATAVQDVCRRL